MSKKYKIGDKVLANGKVAIIFSEYKGSDDFDWEVCFITNPPLNCWNDCYKEKELQPYNWKDYPKTFKQKIKQLFKKR